MERGTYRVIEWTRARLGNTTGFDYLQPAELILSAYILPITPMPMMPTLAGSGVGTVADALFFVDMVRKSLKGRPLPVPTNW